MIAEKRLKELGLPDADLLHRRVVRGMRCIWCNKYRPKTGFRCYGFINSDVDVCISEGYSFFHPRTHRLNS